MTTNRADRDARIAARIHRRSFLTALFADLVCVGFAAVNIATWNC
jgi:hypothetical protein